MGFLKITGWGILGMLAVLAALGLLTLFQRQEVTQAKRDGEIMRELTPDKLISSCGAPELDETNYSGYSDATHPRWPEHRIIEYERGDDPLVLTFDWGGDCKWHLQFFASLEVGVRPDAENADHAVPQLPCLRRGEVEWWAKS